MLRTRRDLEVQLIDRACSDAAFKEALLRDPKPALKTEIGIDLPEEIELRVVEETPDTIYLVLPEPPDPCRPELSEEELEDLAGGFCWGLLRLISAMPDT